MTVNQITVQTPGVKAEHVKETGTSTAFSALIDCLMENAESCAAGRMQGHLGLQDGKGADSQAKAGKQQKAGDDAKKGAPDTNILCMGLPVSMLQYIGMCTGTAKDTGMTSMQSPPQAGKAGKTQNGVSGVTDILVGDCSAAGKKSGLAAEKAVLQAAGEQAAKSTADVSPESGRPLSKPQTVGKAAGSLGTFSLHDAEKAGNLTFAGTDLKNGQTVGNGAPQADKTYFKTETNGKAAEATSGSEQNAQNISEEPLQARPSGRPDSLPFDNGFPEQTVMKATGAEKQASTGDVSAAVKRRTADKGDAEAELESLDGWSAFTGGANAAQAVSSDPNTDKTTSAEKEFAFRFDAGPLAFGQDISNVQDGPRNDSGKISELKGVESVDAVNVTRPVTTARAGKTSKRYASEDVALKDSEEKLKASSDKSTQGGFLVQTAQDGKQNELSVQDGKQQDTAKAIVQKTADAASQAMKAGKSTIHFHLSPEKLGGITIHMVSRGGSLFMKMTADVQDTGRMLAGGLNDLNRSLQQNGVSVGKTEVLLTNGGNMGFTGGFHSGADAQGGRQAYTPQNFGPAEYAAPFQMPVETTAPVFSKISVLA